MKKFVCLECSEYSYSSADIQHQRSPNCPFCGGEIHEVKEKIYRVSWNIVDEGEYFSRSFRSEKERDECANDHLKFPERFINIRTWEN